MLLATLAVLVLLCTTAAARDNSDALADYHSAVGLIDGYYELSEDYWHEGRHDLCLSLLLMIIDLDPRNCDAYASAAWLMENELRDSEAEALLRDGLARNPDVYDLYNELGYFLFSRECHEEAITHLETAVALGAPFLVHHTLAHACELAGNTSEALDLWLWLEAAEPDDPVPARQVDRILSGGPPTNTPATMQRWRNERKAAANRQL